MINHYSTYEAYNDDIQIIKKKRKPLECFICYENINNIRPILLNSNCYYQKKCNCSGEIHKKCLDRWYNIKETCPICRKNMTKNSKELVKIYKYDYNLFVFVIFIKNNIIIIQNIIKIFKTTVYYFLLFCLLVKLNHSVYYILLNFMHEMHKNE
jgi:hypothetical protein